MKLVDAANGLYLTLGSPENVSIPSICAYYRNNYGDINNLLGTSYSVNSSTLELIDSSGCEITDKEISIFNLLYEVRYYTRESRNFMGVGGVDQLVSAESDNGRLTFVNKNTTAASYIQLRKESQLLLDDLVNRYKFSKYSPTHVIGDDESVSVTASRIPGSAIIGNRAIDSIT